MCKCETQKTIAGLDLDLGSGWNTEPKLPDGKTVLSANLISSWAGCLCICTKTALPHPGQELQVAPAPGRDRASTSTGQSPRGAPGAVTAVGDAFSVFSACLLKGCRNVDWVSSKGARGFKFEAFLPTMPGIQMRVFLNNIAHKNHLKICSESRVEGQCFPKENKKLPVHSKF